MGAEGAHLCFPFLGETVEGFDVPCRGKYVVKLLLQCLTFTQGPDRMDRFVAIHNHQQREGVRDKGEREEDDEVSEDGRMMR